MDLELHINEIDGPSKTSKKNRIVRLLELLINDHEGVDYQDKAAQQALERYLEKHRFGLICSFVWDGIRALRKRVQFPENAGIPERSVDTRQSGLRMTNS